jgi:hypothetical protein
MTTEEVVKHYTRMREIWGSKLPNMEQEPYRFEYYVKLYKMYHMEQNYGTTQTLYTFD